VELTDLEQVLLFAFAVLVWAYFRATRAAARHATNATLLADLLLNVRDGKVALKRKGEKTVVEKLG
jgi:hypothetical protein